MHAAVFVFSIPPIVIGLRQRRNAKENRRRAVVETSARQDAHTHLKKTTDERKSAVIFNDATSLLTQQLLSNPLTMIDSFFSIAEKDDDN